MVTSYFNAANDGTYICKTAHSQDDFQNPVESAFRLRTKPSQEDSAMKNPRHLQSQSSPFGPQNLFREQLLSMYTSFHNNQ
eukprot:4870489-Pyramimonas_sp.AAC.1